jgi:hypothetical protein
VRTGVVEFAGRAVQRVTGGSARLAVVVMMLAAAGFSAFMSNTAATAFFLLIALGVARRTAPARPVGRSKGREARRAVHGALDLLSLRVPVDTHSGLAEDRARMDRTAERGGP